MSPEDAPTSPSAEPAADAPELSVVAPCYNEQEGLEEFHRRCRAAMEATGLRYEIVLVDDGSRDRTWPMLQALAETDPHLVLVKLSRNHGHQLALTAGLSVCRGRRVLILDADLQDPPEAIGPMMEIMDAGADVVYGQRRHRAGETAFKRWTARTFYRIINWFSDTPIPVDTGDFRLISRRALDVLQSMPERHRFVRGMVSWIGFRQEPYTYDRDARYAGETKYPLRKMLSLAADAVTSFSTRPLRMAGILGLATAMLGVGLLAYVVVSLAVGSAVPGWASLIAAMAILGSIQLFVLGVFGAYLGRMFEQLKGRPLFVIEQIRRGGGSGPS
jgi:dolichol-phosphate mannosyltransferase